MASGVQLLVTTAVVSVLLVYIAAANGSTSSEGIPTLKCEKQTSRQVTNKEVENGGAPVVLRWQATSPGSQIKLECAGNDQTWDPQLSPLEGGDDKKRVESVYVDTEGPTSVQLQTAIPGATGTTDGGSRSGNTAVILTFPQLPNVEKTIYIRCEANQNAVVVKGRKGADGKQVCVFALTVPAPLPQGPQSCAALGTTVMLGIPGEGDTTQFNCGSGMKLSPTDRKKVYSDDCITEEGLKDMTLTPPGSTSPGFYTLKADKNPPKKRICYLCEEDAGLAQKTTENCKIVIALRGGSQFSARSVFGVALPCVLALLHLA
ncbi:merozoite 31 kDa surface antigen-like [Ochotona princeps]|uniref:merozoite 31 kDa surface antigen-like n=1 Tax=Ochotona princeps TaxID=9978 RepID=UPI002714A030|nr:merozoite 31 kDa surface antigen-like [Ochotona princeps]